MNNNIDEKKEYLGITWHSAIFDDFIPIHAEGSNHAAFLLKKFKPYFVWNTLAAFENNPSTLAQTETILSGISVNGLAVRDLLQIKHFGDAIDFLEYSLVHNEFELSKKIACAINDYIGYDEIIEHGKFRTVPVELNRVIYKPPHPVLLDNKWNAGISYLNAIENHTERAFAVFLFMSRTQFFQDCNKRTALLMMNGELCKNNIQPFFVPKENAEEFTSNMQKFYETGEAGNMMNFLKKLSSPDKVKLSASHKKRHTMR